MEEINGVDETDLQNEKNKKNSECHENNNGVNLDRRISSEKTKLKILELDKRYLIDEDTSAVGGIDLRKANRWRTSAVVISWLSIIATLSIGISEFVVAKAEDSSAAFGLAFSSVLDVLTSAVVLWRYYKAYDTFSQRREHISCIILGVLFIVSSIGIAGKAIFGLLDGDTPDMSERGVSILVITSIVATCVCFILFTVKLVIAKTLSSWTILTDALNSLVGGIIALSMIITEEVTKSNHYLWFLDSTVGLVVSVFLLLYGLWFLSYSWLLTKHVPEMQRIKTYNETK